MKRRLVSFMLVIVMLVTMLPVTAFAAGSVAAVGANEYATLQDAVNNADGKTVVMLDNVTDNTALQIPENTNVTLDMAGKTFTSMDGGSGNWMAIDIRDGATLTLTGNGKIIASCYGVYVEPGATFNLESGSIEVSGNGTYDYGVCVFNGTFNMRGGSVKGLAGVTTADHQRGTTASTVSISAGSIEGSYYGDLTLAGNYDAEISGGSFNGDYAVLAYGTSGTVTVIGGEFDGALYEETPDVIAVKGGTFDTDVSDYLAPGLALAPDGTVTTPLNYVSLGDSMSNGYGLDGYNGNTGVEDYGTQSYANQFATAIGATNHAQLAMSAMRAEDLHWLLEVDYDDPAVVAVIGDLEANGWKEEKWYSVFTNGDYWTWDELVNNYRFDVAAYCIEGKDDDGNFYTGDAKDEYNDVQALQIVAEYYQDSVKNADVISLGMGNGNFGVFAFGRIMEAIGMFGDTPEDAMIYDIENALRECDPALKAQMMTLKAEAEAVLASNGFVVNDGDDETTSTMEALYNTALYSVISYALNYAGSVEAILQLNPDADIIQVALMNTIKSNAPSEDGQPTLGELMDALFIPLNAYIAALPTAMQAVQNSVYADATFYYAEAPYVECIVDTYEEGALNGTVRQRFFWSIVEDEDGDPGMVWGMLGDMVVDITLGEIEAYEVMSDAQKVAYAAANADKAMSISMYLAFEKAIVAGKETPVGIDSIMGLTALFAPGADPFGAIMSDFYAAAAVAGKDKQATVAEILANEDAEQETMLKILLGDEDTIKAYIWDEYKLSITSHYADHDTIEKVLACTIENHDWNCQEARDLYAALKTNPIYAFVALQTSGLLTGAQVKTLYEGGFSDTAIYAVIAEESGGMLDATQVAALANIGVYQFAASMIDGYAADQIESAYTNNLLPSDQMEMIAGLHELYAGIQTLKATDIQDTINDGVESLEDAVAGVEGLCTLLVTPDVLGDVVADSELSGLLALFARCVIGNGIGSHPSEDGHDALAEAVKTAYGEGYTSKDETMENIEYALGALKGFLEEYGPDAADQAYKLWVEMGYQELVDGYIAELTTAIDARYTHYTEVVLPALNDTVDALNAQKDELTAELTTLKDQLAAKKAELEKVLAEQEIPEITPPEFNIETELGNNQQTQVSENDCAGAGNVADELAAAVADLEHAIAVVEALIADVTADIEDMVALATEIAEGVATLEKTLADVAAAAQDLKDAVDAVVTVLTDDSAKGISKTFMKAFNTAREAALIAADALELIVKTVNDDFAVVEESIAALEECAKALADKFDADKEAILMQIAKDIPTEALMIVGGSVMLIQQTLEENKAEIMAGLDAAKNEALTKLTAEKDKVLADLAIEKAKLEAEYGPKIDEAKKNLDAKRVEINNEIQTRLDNLNTDAQIKIDALKTDAQLKIDALNVELQGYMNELNGLAADASAEARAAVQAQIDRVNADIAAVNADLACAIDHVNAELKAAHDAMVAEVNRIYNNAITELQTIYDNLVKAYDDAVKNLQDAADEAIKNLQDAYNEAVKDLTDAADKAIQDLIDAANKELDKLGELGDTLSGIIDGILQAIQGDIAGAQQAISGILNGVQDSVADLGNALVDLGIDTVNALVDEVTNVINDMLYQATHTDLELSNVSSYIALGDGTAVSAGYAEKLAAQLEEEYGVTNFKNYAATSNTVGAEVAAVATREGIADADLITIGFGNVTLLDNAIANAMSDSPVAYDWAELVGEDLVPYIEDALAEAYAEVAAAGMDEEMTAMVNAIVEGFAYGAVEYAIELPALIAAIREVNADAVIVVVGQYNPMDDVVLDLGGDTLDLSEYIDYFVDAVAVHGIGYSVISGDAIFVEAPDVDTDNTDMNWSILDLGKLAYNHFDSLNPSESGDVYIANQILGALNITHVVDTTLLGDVTLDGKVNAEDVTALMAHLVGTQPLTDARALLNGDVDANNKLSANDVTVLLGYLVGTVPALPAL